ncbi:TVP38/TMEM64 family protein [Litorimonas sp. WD9-15]|uniref:TVP38/TMEM64 family protein n=1 Tax=Litorimonas sp. WD9-15 TaxID=3418716 RepID=UPI003D04FD88
MSETDVKQDKPIWIKLWPIYIILAGLGLAISQGWHTYLSPTSLAENAVYLNTLVQENFILVLLAFIVIYILATTFMVPASALTIGGGFLFGLGVGAPATVIGATIGACILFTAAKTSVGEALKSIAGPFVGKMEAGFNESPLSYLFTLRLIPIFPFAVVNIAPAILGAKFRDYLISTLFGIIPGTVAYTWIGAGLRAILLDAAEAGEAVDVNSLVASSAKNLIPAFFALAVVALIPAIYKKFFKKKAVAA